MSGNCGLNCLSDRPTTKHFELVMDSEKKMSYKKEITAMDLTGKMDDV